MKYKEFKEKNILVVGGTSGMGLKVVEELLDLEANVIVIGRNINKQELDHIKKKCHFLKCDISDESEVINTFNEIKKDFGTINFAINNSGITAPYTEISNLDIDKWKKIIDINLTGMAHCLKHEIQLISKNRNGSIVNISSCAGLQALKMQAAYSVSKAGVNMLTQVAAIECAIDKADSYAIRINAIAPGPILGGMNTEENLKNNPEKTERKVAITAMKKFGNAKNIVDGVLWLLSQQASYTTGTILPIDGGFNAGKFN